MTHEDFLNDMYCFYSMNPHMRAVDNKTDACFYRQKCEDGTIKKCAIGRHIPDDTYTESIEARGVDYLSRTGILDELVPSLSKIKMRFLRRVQMFHDDSDFWLPHLIDMRITEYHELLAEAKFLDNNESTR